MNDNWSLKGKEKGYIGSEWKMFWYYREDIETLRQKLIDDINRALKEEGMCNYKMIINKRFGVDSQ